MAEDETSFTVRETAALAGVSERILRNELGRGVVKPLRRRAARGVYFDAAALTYFSLLRDLGLRLGREDRATLFRAIAGEPGTTWRRRGSQVRRGALVLDLTEVEREARRRIRVLQRGRRRLHSDPGIQGGEPVFRGTRLPVRHVGGLAVRGIPVAEILSDHPALDARDVEFARLFVEIGPRPGRPRRKPSFKRVA